MFLKYNCPQCGFEIITKYLKPGDNVICKECNFEFAVPIDAIETDEGPKLFSKSHSQKPLDIDRGDDVKEIEQSEELKLPTPWGIGDVIWFIILYIIGSYCLSRILMPIYIDFIYGVYPGYNNIANPHDHIYYQTFIHFLALIVDILSIGIIYLFVVKRHKNNFFEALRLNKPSRKLIFQYSKIAFIIFAIVFMAGRLVHYTSLANYIPKNMPIYEIYKSYGELRWATFFALLAPIPEEIIFRGFIFAGLRNKIGMINSAIIVTILFVFLHGYQLSYGIIYMIILSIGAIWIMVVRIRTNSLTNCIIIHFFYNFFISIVIWMVVLAMGHLPQVT